MSPHCAKEVETPSLWLSRGSDRFRHHHTIAPTGIKITTSRASASQL